ncbi:site-specific integrase [Methylorubrum aminovorans]|uniref:site-specific integrase n=1 Tax=Methylorubrum aminovorans TaxID=269069 RepID=UPI003C2C9770
MKRKGTSFHQFVQRIPADVAEGARGMTLALPVGGEVVRLTISEKAKDVRVSLRTSDPLEAKSRQAAAIEYLNGIWRSVREGPKRLTHKEAVALAGEVYRVWTDAFEDDPGSAEMWGRVEEANEQAAQGRFGRASLRITHDAASRARSIEERVGDLTNVVLARRGLMIDAESRGRINEQVLSAMRQVSEVQSRRAEGDYTPDPKAARFPVFDEPKAGSKGITLLALFDGWARERKPSQSTVDQWRKHVESFGTFLGHDDATRVTKADVVRWKDALLEAENAPKTINDAKLAALKVAFSWGVANVHVTINPADGVSVKRKAKLNERMLGFTDAEAAKILEAARHSTSPVIRWLPLLCATSGARVGEMAQLRREDVIVERGIPALRITAEAGSVKTANSERTIPIHPAVLAAGFLEFVEGKRGPLFYPPVRRKADAKKPQHKLVGKKVAEWIQTLGLEVGRTHRKDPSHAWRHRFKTLAREAGVIDSVADAIVGHGPKTVSQEYGEATIVAMKKAMEQIPVPGWSPP